MEKKLKVEPLTDDEVVKIRAMFGEIKPEIEDDDSDYYTEAEVKAYMLDTLIRKAKGINTDSSFVLGYLDACKAFFHDMPDKIPFRDEICGECRNFDGVMCTCENTCGDCEDKKL